MSKDISKQEVELNMLIAKVEFITDVLAENDCSSYEEEIKIAECIKSLKLSKESAKWLNDFVNEHKRLLAEYKSKG